MFSRKPKLKKFVEITLTRTFNMNPKAFIKIHCIDTVFLVAMTVKIMLVIF